MFEETISKGDGPPQASVQTITKTKIKTGLSMTLAVGVMVVAGSMLLGLFTSHAAVSVFNAAGGRPDKPGGGGGEKSSIAWEAEDSLISTSGYAISDYWHLNALGKISQPLYFKKGGTYDATISAKGRAMKDIWPIMAIIVDGVAQEIVSVNTDTFSDYQFNIQVPTGLHSVGVAFLNDDYGDGEDRNLDVDNFKLTYRKGKNSITLATHEDWVAESKYREDQTIQDSYADIEKFRKTDAVINIVDSNGDPIEAAIVTVDQTQHDFLFGGKIQFKISNIYSDEEEAIFKQYYSNLFNYMSITMFWRLFEWNQGEPKYSTMDKVVAWGKANDMTMKGHNLLWDHPAGIPRWSEGQPSAELQEVHIKDIINYYEGDVEYWEVVNEPTHYPDLAIDDPYLWAREASADAKLVINDFNIIDTGYPMFFDLLSQAQNNSIPFDAIGLQAHNPKDMAFPLDRVKKVLDMYSTFGKEIHLTEFTPTSDGSNVIDAPWRGTWTEEQQADYAEDFYRVAFAHPQVESITWWDLSDARSWRTGGGLLDENYNPKPAYHALMNLIHSEWQTNITDQTSQSGQVSFRGFYGKYSIIVEVDGIISEHEIHLEEGSDNNFILTF